MKTMSVMMILLIASVIALSVNYSKLSDDYCRMGEKYLSVLNCIDKNVKIIPRSVLLEIKDAIGK